MSEQNCTEQEVEDYQLNEFAKQGISRMEENPSIVQLQLDSSQFIKQIYELLSGKLIIMVNGLPTQVGTGKPWMNDYGISRTLTFFSKFMDKSVLLSNYAKEEINIKAYHNCCNLLELYSRHYTDYEMNLEDVPVIVFMLKDAMMDAYKRALGQGERNSLRSMTQVHELLNKNRQEPQKRGLRK